MQDKPRPQRQGKHSRAGDNAVIEGHPRPADPIPVQSEVPVVFYICLKPLVAVAVPIKDLYHLHAVDILHNGAVHLLGRAVVGAHFAGALLVHGAHGHEPQREGAQSKQSQFPVRKEHGDIDDDRNGNI